LLTLCAARKLNLVEWAAAGPAFFMAGLAVTGTPMVPLDCSTLMPIQRRVLAHA
jgi:hypothetical protein